MLLLTYLRIFLPLILIFSLLLCSCTSVGEPSFYSSVLVSPTPQWAFSVISTPTYVHSFRPGFATICGILMLMNPAFVAPQEDGLYLVPIDTSAGATLIVPVVDRTSYRAAVDEVTGQFCFKDVPQGVYVMIAVTDSGSEIPVRSFETGQLMIVTITQADLNKVIDLGITKLP